MTKDTGTNYTDKEKGLIFHIIHGSFVDGYGIRTTIFLKGCPLRCLWCCNPEGQSGHPELKYTALNCNGCGKCIDVCPKGAIQINPLLEKAQIDRKLCDILEKKFGHHENVCIHCLSLLDWSPEYEYDFIVSALPHNVFEPNFVDQVIDKYYELSYFPLREIESNPIETWDYIEMIKEYNISHVVCRDQSVYLKFSEDPKFQLIFNCGNVAIFQVTK